MGKIEKTSTLESIKEKQKNPWLEENYDAIVAFNRRVEAKGVFSDNLRRF